VARAEDPGAAFACPYFFIIGSRFLSSFHNQAFAILACRRKIEMSPGVQSRDDTPSGKRGKRDRASPPKPGVPNNSWKWHASVPEASAASLVR
jgi:hypothetical protein